MLKLTDNGLKINLTFGKRGKTSALKAQEKTFIHSFMWLFKAAKSEITIKLRPCSLGLAGHFQCECAHEQSQ